MNSAEFQVLIAALNEKKVGFRRQTVIGAYRVQLLLVESKTVIQVGPGAGDDLYESQKWESIENAGYRVVRLSSVMAAVAYIHNHVEPDTIYAPRTRRRSTHTEAEIQELGRRYRRPYRGEIDIDDNNTIPLFGREIE